MKLKIKRILHGVSVVFVRGAQRSSTEVQCDKDGSSEEHMFEFTFWKFRIVGKGIYAIAAATFVSAVVVFMAFQ